MQQEILTMYRSLDDQSKKEVLFFLKCLVEPETDEERAIAAMDGNSFKEIRAAVLEAMLKGGER